MSDLAAEQRAQQTALTGLQQAVDTSQRQVAPMEVEALGRTLEGLQADVAALRGELVALGREVDLQLDDAATDEDVRNLAELGRRLVEVQHRQHAQASAWEDKLSQLQSHLEVLERQHKAGALPGELPRTVEEMATAAVESEQRTRHASTLVAIGRSLLSLRPEG